MLIIYHLQTLPRRHWRSEGGGGGFLVNRKFARLIKEMHVLTVKTFCGCFQFCQHKGVSLFELRVTQYNFLFIYLFIFCELRHVSVLH